MRDVPEGGTRIVGVDAGSVASAARLREGDVITMAGTIQNPSAAEVRAAFDATETGQVLIVAITRSGAHLVEGLEK
jgi:S1-C subfamily serine protease